MQVAVTGAAGRLGQVLLPALAREPAISRIRALDRIPPGRTESDRQAALEARVLELEQLRPTDLEGVDTLVHLAFQLMGGHGGQRRHDRNWVRRQNVALSEQVFRTALAAGVGHLIFVSSAAVYGPWPDSPQPLTEGHPVRPRFPYAEDKVAVEQALQALADEFPACRTTILRPPAILGPHAHPLLLQIARGRLYPGGSRVPVQILWEDDAAAAVVQAVVTASDGVFNLGTDPVWSLQAMARHQRRWALPIPIRALRSLHPLAWRLSARAGDPGWVRGLDGPLVLDCSRARDRLAWTPQVSTPECLQRLRH